LALLYKFINSFGITSRTRGPLSVRDILKSIMPAIQHQNQDVRNASGKILLDVQKLSGCVIQEELEHLPEKVRNVLWKKVQAVAVEKNLLDDNKKQAYVEDDVLETEGAEVSATIGIGNIESSSKVEGRIELIKEKKQIVEEKGPSKDW
jgi:hypothetical protein